MALRRAGLHELVSPTRVIRVEAPAYPPTRTRTVKSAMWRNADYSRRLADAVGGCLGRAEFPLVLGAISVILLGNMLGLSGRGEPALLYVEGHGFLSSEQSTSGGAPAWTSPFVTGWGQDALTDIEGSCHVREERVAVLGNRDYDRLPPAAMPSAA